MHDSFAMIRWSRAGISPGTSGILWSLSVAAEVVVFVVVGRPLLDRIGPTGAAMLSAGAGVVRWAVMAETAWLPALALIEPFRRRKARPRGRAERNYVFESPSRQCCAAP